MTLQEASKGRTCGRMGWHWKCDAFYKNGSPCTRNTWERVQYIISACSDDDHRITDTAAERKDVEDMHYCKLHKSWEDPLIRQINLCELQHKKKILN